MFLSWLSVQGNGDNPAQPAPSTLGPINAALRYDQQSGAAAGAPNTCASIR
jgi:hypothetical protein